MHRSSSRVTAGINSRYCSKDYVLASFMKGKKHAVIPITSININPINPEKGEIKICGDTTPLTIVSKGSKSQMNASKTNFARTHDSEEIDLGQFVDDDEEEYEEKENDENDNFDISSSILQMSPSEKTSINLKENSIDKLVESSYSSRSSITYTKKNKPATGFDEVYNSPSTSNKRRIESDSSLDGSDCDFEEASAVVKKKRVDMNDSNGMLNKLLNRKKPSAKKKTKTTPIIDDSKYVMREEYDQLSKDHAELKKRVNRLIPLVKQFRDGKTSNSNSSTQDTDKSIALSTIEGINESIKRFFGVEANEVTGPKDRPTIIIRHLFRLSNHTNDYQPYLTEHVDLLQAFLQYRCPGITDMKATWSEIEASMKTLHNDVKKNTKTKEVRQGFKQAANQSRQQQAADQPPQQQAVNQQQQRQAASSSTNDEITTPVDIVEHEEII